MYVLASSKSNRLGHISNVVGNDNNDALEPCLWQQIIISGTFNVIEIIQIYE